MKLIAPLTGKSSLTVQNSREFVGLVRDLDLDEKDVMVCFDVVPLFTNVPTNLTVKIAETRLPGNNTLSTRTALVDDIVILLRLSEPVPFHIPRTNLSPN